jgi:NitT/TauT family transport system substrate-binding protein
MVARGPFLAASAAALGAAAGGRASAQTRIPLHIGAAANDSFAEAYYAQQLGYFDRAGFDVEITNFGGGAQVTTGVESGAIDIGISSVISLAIATVRGLPFVYIAGGGIYTADKPTLALCVAKDSPLHGAHDLEGKTISISGIKDLTHLSVFVYMLKSGADPTKVSFIELPFSQVGAALQRGTIAAGIISEPSLSAAVDDVRILAYAESYIAKRLMVAGWFSTMEWFKKNMAAAHAFARVIYDAGRWANANQDKSLLLLDKYAKLEPNAHPMARAVFLESLPPDMIDPTLELAGRLKFTDRRVRASEMIAPGM